MLLEWHLTTCMISVWGIVIKWWTQNNEFYLWEFKHIYDTILWFWRHGYLTVMLDDIIITLNTYAWMFIFPAHVSFIATYLFHMHLYATLVYNNFDGSFFVNKMFS